MDFFQIVCERLYNNNQFIITQSEEHVLSHMVTTNNSILKYFSKEISDTKGTKQSKINNTESDVPKLEEKIFKRKINGDDEEDDSIIIGTKKPKQKAVNQFF